MFNRLISVAPMMDCTDRHFRRLARVVSRRVLLYTEMLTSAALLHGDRAHLLAYNPEEHPVALQLGGSQPAELAKAAKLGEDYGFDEINLNVGCPSSRVQSGKFGACLMLEPKRVACCVEAMQAQVQVPVTVKTRLGVDDHDSYQHLQNFVQTVASAGCGVFIIHARKAWLQGLSPRENRTIPPLCYDSVYQLKSDFPHLTIIINGGVSTHQQIQQHLAHVDGVMIGRQAYATPQILAACDRLYYGEPVTDLSPHEIVQRYLPYVTSQLAQGIRLRQLTRHLVGLFHGCRGAKGWRRYLSQYGGLNEQGVRIINNALQYVSA